MTNRSLELSTEVKQNIGSKLGRVARLMAELAEARADIVKSLGIVGDGPRRLWRDRTDSFWQLCLPGGSDGRSRLCLSDSRKGVSKDDAEGTWVCEHSYPQEAIYRCDRFVVVVTQREGYSPIYIILSADKGVKD
mgnify:CR=1 FL=1